MICITASTSQPVPLIARRAHSIAALLTQTAVSDAGALKPALSVWRARSRLLSTTMTPTAGGLTEEVSHLLNHWTAWYSLPDAKSRARVYAKQLRNAIDHDFHPAYVPDSITELPRRRGAARTAASPIAAFVFPEFTQSNADIHYSNALMRARRVVRQRKDLEQRTDSVACEMQVRYSPPASHVSGR